MGPTLGQTSPGTRTQHQQPVLLWDRTPCWPGDSAQGTAGQRQPDVLCSGRGHSHYLMSGAEPRPLTHLGRELWPQASLLSGFSSSPRPCPPTSSTPPFTQWDNRASSVAPGFWSKRWGRVGRDCPAFLHYTQLGGLAQLLWPLHVTGEWASSYTFPPATFSP